MSTKQIRYRTEAFSGSGERDIIEVMVFETFELGNSDILDTLRNGVLVGGEFCSILESVSKMIETGEEYKWSKTAQISFFKRVLAEITEVTGRDFRYALWLADKDTVKHFYGKLALEEEVAELSEGAGLCDELIDQYEVGDVVLSELGYDGTLYGYEEMPVPLER